MSIDKEDYFIVDEKECSYDGNVDERYQDKEIKDVGYGIEMIRQILHWNMFINILSNYLPMYRHPPKHILQ